MREMHWNIWEYEHCPKSVIDQIWAFLETESKYIETQREELDGR